MNSELFNLPPTDEQAKNLEFFRPAQGHPGDAVLVCTPLVALAATCPAAAALAGGAGPAALRRRRSRARGRKEMTTTMAFVRMLGKLFKDNALGPRILPIVADEAHLRHGRHVQAGRTYSSAGQSYEPEDIGSVLSYRGALQRPDPRRGHQRGRRHQQLDRRRHQLQGARRDDAAVRHQYSMFGFQRVGELIWAAADQRSRGFLLGATEDDDARRRRPEHQDGSSHLGRRPSPTAGPTTQLRRRDRRHPPRGMREMSSNSRTCSTTSPDERELRSSGLPPRAHATTSSTAGYRYARHGDETRTADNDPPPGATPRWKSSRLPGNSRPTACRPK